MAIGDEVGGPPEGDDAGGAPGGAPPGPGGPPPGGGPMLAALAGRQQGPQPSAPGPGDQASAMTMLQNATALIQQALPSLPQGSPIHTSALRAVQQISRHLGQGQPTAGVQQTQLRDLLQSTIRNALLQKIMGQQQQGGGGQGADQGGPAGPSPVPGAMAQAPMPSTPLPGA